MLRTPFASERIQMTDPTTGIKVIQLTSYPSPSAHLPYDWPSITPDNRWILLYSQRWTQRTAPWDIFRVDADGLNLFQLTEDGQEAADAGYYGRQHAIMSHDGKLLYVLWANRLKAVDVETGEQEELLSLEQYASEGVTFARMCLNGTGERIFVSRWGADTTVRIDLSTGKTDEVVFEGTVVGCFQEEPRILVQRGKVIWGTEDLPGGGRRVINAGQALYLWSVDEDGGDAREICEQKYFAHYTLHGKQSKVQGCGQVPERCIWIAEEGKEPEKLVQGPYFWHSGPSFDGEWICADTNWPDSGLQYIHVPSRRFRTLCHPNATREHYEFGHPHPTVSMDGRLVVFRSDRTGMSQVYVAHVTEEFRESVKAGELDRPKDKWI